MMIRNTPIRNSVTQGTSYGAALPELHRRLRWVALVGIAAFALLVGRLWQLQVMRGESYYERTVSNVVKERYLPSVRGQILDRKGTPHTLAPTPLIDTHDIVAFAGEPYAVWFDAGLWLAHLCP